MCLYLWQKSGAMPHLSLSPQVRIKVLFHKVIKRLKESIHLTGFEYSKKQRHWCVSHCVLPDQRTDKLPKISFFLDILIVLKLLWSQKSFLYKELFEKVYLAFIPLCLNQVYWKLNSTLNRVSVLQATV